jgi:hypothetical protein
LAGTGPLCSTNGDCLSNVCNQSTGRCSSNTDLDTGWTGIAHDSDVTDNVTALVDISCAAGTAPCGVCDIDGVNPEPGNCRCANDNTAICDEPFVADADDCGGNICNCYLGPPLALSSGNTPACVVNKLAQEVTGTLNVDTGERAAQLRLRAVVYLGHNLVTPCPSCGGTCTAPVSSVDDPCARDVDCDSALGAGDGACGNFDTTPDDGVRDGTCYVGANAGSPCDIQATHSTFPAPGGGGHSLDCFPDAGKNVSGQGLDIRLDPSTGSGSLTAGIECGILPFVVESCHCGVCSDDSTAPCSSNADCSVECVRVGQNDPRQNQCSDSTCTDSGDGSGQCDAGPMERFCDAIVRANGEGFIACLGNADCDPGTIGLEAGACTLSKLRGCFAPTILAQGTPDPEAPTIQSIFCIPPTSNGGINSVAGLPGPGRVLNQTISTSYCDAGRTQAYVPGVGGCP